MLGPNSGLPLSCCCLVDAAKLMLMQHHFGVLIMLPKVPADCRQLALVAKSLLQLQAAGHISLDQAEAEECTDMLQTRSADYCYLGRRAAVDLLSGMHAVWTAVG